MDTTRKGNEIRISGTDDDTAVKWRLAMQANEMSAVIGQDRSALVADKCQDGGIFLPRLTRLPNCQHIVGESP